MPGTSSSIILLTAPMLKGLQHESPIPCQITTGNGDDFPNTNAAAPALASSTNIAKAIRSLMQNMASFVNSLLEASGMAERDLLSSVGSVVQGKRSCHGGCGQPAAAGRSARDLRDDMSERENGSANGGRGVGGCWAIDVVAQLKK